MIEKIEFFTAGCPRSQISEKNLRKALQKLGIDIAFKGIDDPKEHEAAGVKAFPAVKINNEIKSEGAFLSTNECVEILSEYQ